MKASSAFLLILILPFITLMSCSKNDNGPQGNLGKRLTGSILHQYTTEVKKIDASTSNESTLFSYKAGSTAGWDISHDGSLRLMSLREAGVYDRNRFKIIRVSDEVVLKEFDYIPRFGNYTNNRGELSFDNSLILVNPDHDNGIVIIDTDGTVKYRLDNINDKQLTRDDKAVWLPDNSILICFDGRFLLRGKAPFTNLTLVKEMNYENWGNLRVSNDGKKVSMVINDHIYIMDIDGSNLIQVTESDGSEVFGEFSPDNKYLLVGADYFHAPVSSNSHWFLKIVPADGKKYNLNSSPEVIPVIPNGQKKIVKANEVTYWRP